jgi:hypothetical protein
LICRRDHHPNYLKAISVHFLFFDIHTENTTSFVAMSQTANSNPATAALEETLQKVQSSVIPAVDQLISSSSATPSSTGLDFLHAKNTLLLSYLIDWMVHLRENHGEDNGEIEIDRKNDEEDSSSIRDASASTRASAALTKQRLLEMRTALDKTRGLDKKLRYQIDKLLAAAATSSSFVTRLHHEEQEEGTDDEENPTQQPEDPLQFRPDPSSFLDDDDDDDDDLDDDDGNHDYEKVKDEDDEDLAAARQALTISTQKSKSSKNSKQENGGDKDKNEEGGNSVEEPGIYHAPRLTAVPYMHDVQQKRLSQDKRQRRRLRASELAQTLRDQYGEAPDQEDMHGGGNSDLYGKQRAAAKKLAQQQAERTEYEESNMIRLMTSRKEKKEKKRIQRLMEGGSNLAQIANLSNLVRETQEFGRADDASDDYDEHMAQRQALEDFHKSGGQKQSSKDNRQSSSRYVNGKRKRERGDEGSRNEKSKKGRLPKAQNSLQAALYGDSSASISKKMKSKGRNR